MNTQVVTIAGADIAVTNNMHLQCLKITLGLNVVGNEKGGGSESKLLLDYVIIII